MILELKPSDRRRASRALLAFGVAGVVLLVGVLAAGLAALSAVDDATRTLEQDRAELSALLGPARTTLADAASSAANASTSLDATSAAATRAAQLTDSLAASFDGFAALGNIDILGARPFAASAAQFATAASDARSLSSDLTATAASMQTNVGDSAKVATDLRSLAAELDRLDSTIGAKAPPDAGSGLPIAMARLVLLGLVAWLAVPAVVSLWLGWRLRGTA